MNTDTDSCSELDTLIFKLYGSARTPPFSQFRDNALELLKRYMHFDAAIWGFGVFNERAKISSIHLHNLPLQMRVDYSKVAHLDFLAARIASNLGTPFIVPWNDPELLKDQYAPLRDYRARYSIAHAISTSHATPELGLGHFLSLFRAGAMDPWKEAERSFKQKLVPHLCESYMQARYLHMRVENSNDSGYVIADRDLVINQTTTIFDSLMKVEWPGWRGKRLPKEVRARFTSGRTYFMGRRITISMESDQTLVHVWIRRSNAIDQLSPAELEVAQGVAEGKSNQQIADARGTTLSTTVNQVKRIYEKLGISGGNRAALANRMQELS